MSKSEGSSTSLFLFAHILCTGALLSFASRFKSVLLNFCQTNYNLLHKSLHKTYPVMPNTSNG